MVTSVETALRLGAEGVSIQVNFDGKTDAQNLGLLGTVVDRCLGYGLPVLTMVYDKVAASEESLRIERQRHLMRIAVELGTDAIKIAPPSSLAGVAPLLEGITDDVAVFFAGGALASDEALFTLTKEALACGAAGLCVGRNIFQRPSPGEFLSQLSRLMRLPEETVPAVREVRHGLH
jgi:class I fructose-bisphosphate aldolase/fructose-bisphosphate aldolase/2-amino-3,7-dideoxy-D-threo-hept-6-ulosonate synthase